MTPSQIKDLFASIKLNQIDTEDAVNVINSEFSILRNKFTAIGSILEGCKVFLKEDESYYGKIYRITEEAIEVKWETPCPNRGTLGGITRYRDFFGALKALRIEFDKRGRFILRNRDSSNEEFGGGMGVFLKQMLAKRIQSGEQVIIIDPDSECRHLSQCLG